MPKSGPAYPPEFRHQLIELLRGGRTPEQLAQEFEPSAQTIRNWIHQAKRDAGQRTDGLTTPQREELTRRRRELRQSSSTVRSWQKLRSGSHGRPARSHRAVRVREGSSGRLPGRDDVSRPPGLLEWLLRVAAARSCARTLKFPQLLNSQIPAPG